MLGASTAHAEQSLKFFKNYFLTGDYVAAGVGLRGTGVNGLATGTITIDPNQIPAGAEIVAAYLYWETLGPSSGAAALTGAQFQKNNIGSIAVLLDPGGSPACSTGGDDHDDADSRDNTDDGASKVYIYRADVLPYLERINPATRQSRCRSWQRVRIRSRCRMLAMGAGYHRRWVRAWLSSTASWVMTR